jgi:hypothetical protein
MPETTSRIGWPGVTFLPVRANAPSANLYITYTAQDDAPVVRAFLNILHQQDGRGRRGGWSAHPTLNGQSTDGAAVDTKASQ